MMLNISFMRDYENTTKRHNYKTDIKDNDYKNESYCMRKYIRRLHPVGQKLLFPL